MKTSWWTNPIMFAIGATFLAANIVLFLSFRSYNSVLNNQIAIMARRFIVAGDFGTAREMVGSLRPVYIDEYSIRRSNPALKTRTCPASSVHIFFDKNRENLAATICYRPNLAVFYRAVFMINVILFGFALLFFIMQKRFSNELVAAEEEHFQKFLQDLEMIMQQPDEGKHIPDDSGPSFNLVQEDIGVGEKGVNGTSAMQMRIHRIVEIYLQQRMEASRQRAIAELASQVAHDIRGPLSVLNIIGRQIDQLTVEQRNLMLAAISRTNSIAQDLLDSRRSLVRSKSEGPTPINFAIENIVQEKRIQHNSNDKLKLKFKTEICIPMFVQNGNQIVRAISNVIDNAVEAVGERGIIEVDLSVRGDLIVIRIADNGGGIPDHVLQRLGKEPISYGKRNSSSGSGLGLYSAVQLIKSLNGKFEITSKICEGTIVTITLPYPKMARA